MRQVNFIVWYFADEMECKHCLSLDAHMRYMGTEAHVLMETGYYSSPPYMNFGRIIYVTIILYAMRILGHVISV